MTRHISLIGAPTDIGAGARGASMGPEACAWPACRRRWKRHGLQVRDRGNLAARPTPGCRRWTATATCRGGGLEPRRARRRACRAAAGRLPILLGGDHCLGIGSISAVARHCREAGKKLRVLWLDAHADFNTSDADAQRQHPRHAGGLPVRARPAALTEIGGQVPALNPKSVRQIGIRSVDPGEKRFVHEAGLEVFDMRYIDEMGMRHTMELALATLDANTHLHVSFDVDFLDPDIAPGVGTTVPGGPTYREAQLCMEMIADTGRLASLDVMELNPALDVRNKTAELAVDLMESLFGKSTLMRTTTPAATARCCCLKARPMWMRRLCRCASRRRSCRA
jgi:arginase